MKGGSTPYSRTGSGLSRLYSLRHRFGRAGRRADTHGQGFTVVEVLIVLAVTGGLFASAVLLISGKQNQTAFDQATRQIQSQIRQTINEVASGFYPSSSNFKCTATPLGPDISNGGTNQGANAGCIFLGKVLQFKVQDSDPEQFNTFSVAGLQRLADGSGDEVTSLEEAKPKVVNQLTQSTPLQGGLTVDHMTYNGASIGAVAFVNSLASYNGGTIQSGSEQVEMAPVNGTGLDQTTSQAAGLITSHLAGSTLNPSKDVQICFVGGNKQYALISIGGDERQLSVTLTIKGDTAC